MTDIFFPPQKHDYVFISGLIYHDHKQVMVDFLVDTGASTTMIDPQIMARIGYTPSCKEFIGMASVSGPAGKETGYRVKAQKILVHTAQFAIKNIEIVCIRPEHNVEALLGINFLKHFHYCFNHKEHLLSLKPL